MVLGSGPLGSFDDTLGAPVQVHGENPDMQHSTTSRPRHPEGRARRVRLEEQIDAWKALLVGDLERDRELLDLIVSAAEELDRLATTPTEES